MSRSVTIVLPIRNREPERLRRVVSSLRKHGSDPHFLVVDYGSELEFSELYEKLTIELGLDLEKMASRGLPWNKSWAINRGARIAKTDFIATSDVDIIYDSDPISYCLAQDRKDACFHVETYWLDESGNRRKARRAGHGSPGGYQFIHRSAFEMAGGYDERIVYWGLEDLDWPARLKKLGNEQIWLPEPHRAYHQWHPRAESAGIRPEIASYDTAAFCVDNLINPVLQQNWGRPLGVDDRPILPIIDSGKLPEIVRIPANGFMAYARLETLVETRLLGGYIRLELGSRMIHRPLDRFREMTKNIIRPLSALTGNTVIDKMNYNFDYIYRMFPVLYANGLRDHFVSRSLDSISLLWE